MAGAAAAYAELAALDGSKLGLFSSYHAVRAELCATTGRTAEARAAYQALLALDPSPAERHGLSRKLGALG